MKTLIITFLFICPFVAADSHFSISAGELETSCRANVAMLNGADIRNPRDAMNIGTCTGFIDGWRQGATTILVWNPPPKKNPSHLEIEEGVDIGQICKVFVKYMDQHPEKENEPASLGLMDALFDAKLAKFTDMPTNGYSSESR